MLGVDIPLWLGYLYAVEMLFGHGERVGWSGSVGFFHLACLETSCPLREILGGWGMLAQMNTLHMEHKQNQDGEAISLNLEGVGLVVI
jgi:hypothetical protein